MLGATGAVGRQALASLVHGARAVQVTTLGRRPVDLPDHSRLVQHQVDIHDPSSYADCLGGQQVAICTLGVGQPSQMSKAEFTRVDKDAVLMFANACRAAGVKHFELLSSVGVDARSRSFYLRTKGELQEALEALGFERLSLFQPSMILTPTNRYGWSQALTLVVWPKLDGLLRGRLKRFRGIGVEELGRAMAVNALNEGTGVETVQWSGFKRLASQDQIR
ncbi:hypothetical protein LPB72_00710 [Hydrogenophaga crassostreae]|uniref:NAD(P)-binding domain-containing protein n=2 Tax=Hydrogenophaga crassostreae TaxID=1763535 RepID=A0A162Z8G3_9BURK|nr:hypothetical protein LPB072_15110 [Hydrogenophaga crassostreae]OAD44322.1 hypothetical protein LPB72_00710 [Hydrogenophaga crassostreae]